MGITTLSYSLASDKTFLAARGNTAVPPPSVSVPTDPYYQSVMLLLHGNGSDGSTTILDSSPSNKTMSVTGSAQVSTTQKKWGTGSIYIPSSNSYVTHAASVDFELSNGDFTIESWVYITDTNTNLQTIFTIGNYLSGLLVRVYNPSSGIIDVYCNGSQYSFNQSAIAVNTWHHIVLVRSGTTARVFFNGAQFGSSVTMTQTIPTGILYVGMSSHNAAEYLHGYIDDFRLTKGVARYSVDFLPPSSEFPDQ